MDDKKKASDMEGKKSKSLVGSSDDSGKGSNRYLKDFSII